MLWRRWPTGIDLTWISPVKSFLEYSQSDSKKVRSSQLRGQKSRDRAIVQNIKGEEVETVFEGE